jgi:cardiolipin synthase
MLVDEMWSLIGSANWDPRSVRLNFEFNVECYSQELSRELNSLFEKKLKNAKNLSLEDVDGRPLPIKIRDGVARLFTPYL